MEDLVEDDSGVDDRVGGRDVVPGGDRGAAVAEQVAGSVETGLVRDPLVDYLHELSLQLEYMPHRLRGTVIFLCIDIGVIPMARRTRIEENHSHHDLVVPRSWRTSHSLTTATGSRVEIVELTGGEDPNDAVVGGVVCVNPTLGSSDCVDPIRVLRDALVQGNQTLARLDHRTDLYSVSVPVARFDSGAV